ncbi:HD domain-containing protein [Dehalobacterium formicoaceticum]|uniref:HD domain-containing protein n=1 Tax=Dehalobacterium formicoaceticum TaxID=51515 RepID=A0ABT1Y736_9FIRM|nr:HD domain-containing protein [Dehalobacterium formicoaceticum]MCR6545501.1 HD domain-containing protein [Dehalobacterium formicoaceticum]
MGKKDFEIVGAIDVGTHNLHLTIAQVHKNGKIVILEDLTKPTNIGSDAFTTGRIQNETIIDTLKALKGFAFVLREYKVKKVRAIAKSALREAENREYVLEHIRMKTGITVEIINNAQERFLMYKALRYQAQDLNLTNYRESGLIINIASGGTEVSIYHKGNLEFTEYIKIGVLRLHETLAELQHKTIDYAQVMEDYIDSKLSMLKPIMSKTPIKYFVGLGSECNTVFRLLEPGDDHYIRQETLTDLYERVRVMMDDQLMERYALSPREAETFLPAVIILHSFFKMTLSKGIYAPKVVLRHGILYDLADQLFDHFRQEEYQKDIISSVWYIANKYRADKLHSAQVAKLSLTVFDQTKKLHKLGERERLYLEIAAILHNIGYFVNFSDHDNLSYALILRQNIMGLANEELDLIAQIVRYHDHEEPGLHHQAYQILSFRDKITVSKLAAILKLSNSLDVSQGQKIQGVKIVFSENILNFYLKTKHNILLEEWTFSQKASFFEEVLGVRPQTRIKK